MDDMLTRSAARSSGSSFVKSQETSNRNYRNQKCDEPLIFPQDSVFKDLGEGILENALQVGIRHSYNYSY